MSGYIFVLDDGGEIPIVIESRRGARNITLRPKTAGEFEIHMSKPYLVSDARALNLNANGLMVYLRAHRKSALCAMVMKSNFWTGGFCCVACRVRGLIN